MASRTATVEVPVEVTDAVMQGVVSMPHGWGHGVDGTELGVAARHAGVNSNLLADGELIDPLSGNAVLNGIPVRVEPVQEVDLREDAAGPVAGPVRAATGILKAPADRAD